jgi:hypothetical protein
MILRRVNIEPSLFRYQPGVDRRSSPNEIVASVSPFRLDTVDARALRSGR